MSDILTENNAWAIPLPDDWEYYLLSNLISFYVDNRGKTAPTEDAGIPLIATNCIKNENLYPTYERIRYVSRDTYDEWFRAHPEPNDIIIVNKGTPGLTNLVPDPVDFVIAQDMMAIRANEQIVYPLYLFAALRSPHFLAQVNALTVGTTIPHLKKGDFDKLIIPVPPLHIQKEIGNLYINFSYKIDANRRINETLLNTIRTIFKSWFIDFDPVHTRIENVHINGLDNDILDLFPVSFDESQFGEIPKGWQVKSIGDVVDVVGGSTPSTREPQYWDEGTINWATPKDLSNMDTPVLLGTDRRITEIGLQQISSGLLPKGTLLLSSRAPVGYLAIAETPVAINQGFIAMICNALVPNLYALFWTEYNLSVIKSRASGTTFQEISKHNFRPIPILIPSTEIMQAYLRIIEPIYSQVVLNVEESVALVETRDALLPKLVSGKILL